MEMTIDEMAQNCMDAITKTIKDLKTLNIIVMGKSGVGKSTLINSVFREKLAETGIGRPVTSEIRQISKEGYPLAIYDTPGFELGKEQQRKVKDEILDIIKKGQDSGDINKAIHCIWYCINAAGNRTFDESELKWMREFTESNKVTQVPTIVVLTQAAQKKSAEEMKKEVEKENLAIAKVVPVLAQDIDFDGEYTVRAYGLGTLVDVMSEVLPKELRDTLQNVQQANLDSKKRRAQAAVAIAVAASFGEGFIPIPFSDAAALIPTQITMIASITAIFGLNIDKSILTSFVSSTIGTAGATILGKTVVSNLLKLIPGVGTAIGGLISGATAGLITTALGEAYIKVMEMVWKGEIKKEDLFTEKGKEEMVEIFKDELKKKKS